MSSTASDEENEKEKQAVYENLEFILRNDFGNELVISNYSVEDLVPFGTNFRSVVLKISVEFKCNKTASTEELHLVAKILPTVMLEISQKTNWIKMFKREILMYTDIIPLYETLELNYGIDEKKTIATAVPKMYGSRTRGSDKKDQKNAIILLENLNLQGYHVMDRKIGLDFDHAMKALNVIARFHALGIAAKTHNASAFEPIKQKYRKPDYDYQVTDKIWDKFVDDIESDSRYSAYHSRVQAIAKRRKGNWKYDATCSDLWSTIIHYDLTVPNIMFRSDGSGNVDSVKLIDFQTYFFADIFLDLTYFLCGTLNDEVKMNRIDELINGYYKTFIRVLKRMQVDVGPYSKQKFDDRFKEIAHAELLHCSVVLKMFTADIADKSAEKETVVPTLMSAEGNDLYYKKLTQLLQIYEERDWFI